ncbi:GGDEF domain-containing protein [Nitrosovibrio sp. Nv6]|uniref:GGDEF domain-containing protein n=1 Tax=Nitrosovibrio sp. Nv6 TaxID=1855340 RepID=UPI001314DC06|nr:GGDEF domain-containing protein [Nitrosovibrio sp. Nv6]
MKTALEKNQDVREKIEDCAAELSTVNETVKKEMVAGITLQQAKKALAQSERVEDKVQDCASKLDEVNSVLAQEIDDRNKLNLEFMEIKGKLVATENILSNTQDVMAIAQEVAEEAKQRSLWDVATGIPNRELFSDRLEQAIALARRNTWVLAVMFIDLDRFKLVNDTYGHATGDKVLQTVAQRLHRRVRGEDTLCRYGGDEFLYLLVNPKSLQNIQRIAAEVFDCIAQPVIIDDLTLTMQPSIGIAVYPHDGNTGLELVANADAAMYRAKKTKAGYTLFDNVDDHSSLRP